MQFFQSTIRKGRDIIRMISLEFDNNSGKNLYVQLYEYLREEISEGRITPREKLSSLRDMAKTLGISITTVKIAYDQLVVEGYLVNRPHSGFYAADGAGSNAGKSLLESRTEPNIQGLQSDKRASDGRSVAAAENGEAQCFSCDPASFDFIKWKKCMASVLNETPEMLLSEADRQGEPELRKEIASYLYRSRGVVCTPGQIVISAGTQQLVNHLAKILRMMDIGLICTEDPGYLPVRNSFRDWGFSINNIPVKDDGVEIERLPINIRTAVYVCPQNQFPTGAVMPVGRRHQILDWAEANNSIIIEDDYNSELRYFGMPVPALQGLDDGRRVVYLGSFSSTLFPAVRISYMVLPQEMAELYEQIRLDYDQTCSKTEQLTLALFMKRGYYQTNLRKVKKLYSRKLEAVLDAIHECDEKGAFISAENSDSGINLSLRVNTRAMVITEGANGSGRVEEMHHEMAERMIRTAAASGIRLKEIAQLSHDGQIYLIFYYNQIPMEKIRELVKDVIAGMKATVSKGGLNMPSVYEVVRIKDSQPLFLKEHYERLEASLGSLGMEPPFSFAELEQSVSDMTNENSIIDHNLKIEVDVSGYSVIYMNPTHYPPEDLYKKGIRTDILHGERRNPNIKMMDQELRDAADKAIRQGDLYEVLLADRNDCITEGSRSNVFFIRGGEVITPPAAQVLKGVTRLKIIEIIKEMGVRLREETVNTGDLENCDAAFISGTSPGVLPIASIGKIKYDVNDPVMSEIKARYELQFTANR